MLHDCICALAPNRASEKAGQAKDAAKDTASQYFPTHLVLFGLPPFVAPLPYNVL